MTIPSEVWVDDPADDEPGEEDIFIIDTGPLLSIRRAYWCQREIASESNKALPFDEQIQEWMACAQYWPNVWYVSDHGNTSLYPLEVEIPR
jgi:hypothetical protein